MPELHSSFVVSEQSLQARHLQRSHMPFPAHDTSHSSHLVSCAIPDEHARNLAQKAQSLHLHVSQCEPLFASLQCDRHPRELLSFELKGTHEIELATAPIED